MNHISGQDDDAAELNGITWMNCLLYSGPAISANSVQLSLAVFRRRPLTVPNQLGSPNAPVAWGRDPQADLFSMDSQDTNLDVGADSDALPCFTAQNQHGFGSDHSSKPQETEGNLFCSRRTLSIAYVLEFSTSRQEKLDVEANAFYA